MLNSILKMNRGDRMESPTKKHHKRVHCVQENSQVLSGTLVTEKSSSGCTWTGRHRFN